MKSLAGAAMTPSGMLAGTAAGTAGIIASQEEFERQMIQMGLDAEERKKRMYERYPEQIPMASGGRTGFAPGGQTGEDAPREDLYINDYYGGSDYSDPMSRFNPSGGYGGGNTGGYGNYGGFNTNAYAPRARRTRQFNPGFMPGFGGEQRYFQGNNPLTYLTQYARDIAANNPDATPTSGASPAPQPMAPPGGFREERGYTPPPPMFGGYGNPYMQRPSYQSFYGNPQSNMMINPYAAFSQMPIPMYQPPQDTTPPEDSGTTPPPPNDGGTTPPDDGTTPPPITPPIDIPGIGRKGLPTNVNPGAPTDGYVNPAVTPPAPAPAPAPYTPPPTVTIPIEGGADVTIPDYSQPQPPSRPGPPADFNPAAGIPGSGVPPVGNPGAFDNGLPNVSDYDGFSPEELDDMRDRYRPEPEPVAPPAAVAPPVIAPPVIAPPIKSDDRFSISRDYSNREPEPVAPVPIAPAPIAPPVAIQPPVIAPPVDIAPPFENVGGPVFRLPEPPQPPINTNPGGDILTPVENPNYIPPSAPIAPPVMAPPMQR